jgi:hypothetical protein
MKFSMKVLLTAIAIVLLIVLGINAWNYFAYGGFTGSFFSIAVIAMAYGFAATAIVVLLTKIWTKS